LKEEAYFKHFQLINKILQEYRSSGRKFNILYRPILASFYFHISISRCEIHAEFRTNELNSKGIKPVTFRSILLTIDTFWWWCCSAGS